MTSVEGALELLDAFEQMAVRPQIEATLETARRDFVFEIFKRDLKAAQAEFEHAKVRVRAHFAATRRAPKRGSWFLLGGCVRVRPFELLHCGMGALCRVEEREL